MNSVQKGDQAELAVAADLARQGCGVAFPFSTSCNWDLLTWREDGEFIRIQVKYAELVKGAIPVRTRTHSNTSSKQTARYYTAKDFDVLAVWCPFVPTHCYYIAATELGEGRSSLHLRVLSSDNNQTKNIRWSHDYLELPIVERIRRNPAKVESGGSNPPGEMK